MDRRAVHRIVAAALGLALVASTIWPAVVAANGMGSVYVADPASGTVWSVDGLQEALVASIETPPEPVRLAYNQAGTVVYVADRREAKVTKIETKAEAVHSQLTVEAPVVAMASSPDDRWLWATSTEGDLLRIDSSGGSATARVHLDGGASWVALSPAGDRVYVALENARSVAVLEAASLSVVTNVALTGTPASLAISRDGRKLFVACREPASVRIVDLERLVAIADVSLPSTPTGLALRPFTNEAYVVLPDAGSLAVIDAERGQISRSVALPAGPRALAFAPDGTRAYVAAGQKPGRLLTLEPASGAVVTALDVGESPVDLVVSPLTVHEAGPEQSGVPLTVPARLPRTGDPLPAATPVLFGFTGAGLLWAWIRRR